MNPSRSATETTPSLSMSTAWQTSPLSCSSVRALSTLALRNLLKKFTLMKPEDALLRAWFVFEAFLVSISLSSRAAGERPFYWRKTVRRRDKDLIGYLS